MPALERQNTWLEDSPASNETPEKMPNPSPPPSVAGHKRRLAGAQAHELENGKSAKVHETATPKPLELNYKRPAPGALLKRYAALQPQPEVQIQIQKSFTPRPTARKPVRSKRATPDSRAAPGMSNIGRTPNSAPPTPAQAPNLYYPTQNRAQVHVTHMQGLTAAPQQYPQPMAPVVIASHTGGYGSVAYAPMIHPHGFYQVEGAALDPRPPAADHVHYQAHPEVPDSLYTDPHNAAEAKSLWEKLHPLQKAEFLRLLQSQDEDMTTPSQRESSDEEGELMDDRPDEIFEATGGADTLDGESRTGDADMLDGEPRDPGSSDKGKGRATDDSHLASHEDPTPQQPPVDNLTNHFGAMLLSHVQESHDQMTKLMAEFMTQQSEGQERFRETVAQEFRSVHSRVRQLQNPLPVSGRRHPGHKGASSNVQGSEVRHTVASPRKSKAPYGEPTSDPSLQSHPELEAVVTKLQSSVRAHLKQMLKFTTWAELVERHPPLSEAEIHAFGSRNSTITCTEEDFRVDFIHDWKRLPLNLHARDLFVQNLLKCIKGGAFNFEAKVIPFITEVHVERALDSHMEHCRRKYRETYNLLAWDSGDEEDVKQETHQQQKLENEKKRKAVNSRKKTLMDARLFVIANLGLQRHFVLFDLLFARNMSGDETDGTRRRLPMAYRIVECRWQSVAFKTFLRALDAMYRRAWEKPKPGQRATGGNPPRTRISRPDGRVEDGCAPCGLWRNCYDEEWLSTLAPYQKRALNIVEAEYDFDLTPVFDGDSKMGEQGEEGSEDEVEEEL